MLILSLLYQESFMLNFVFIRDIHFIIIFVLNYNYIIDILFQMFKTQAICLSGIMRANAGDWQQ